MAASVEQFFQGSAEALNRSVGERDGPDAVRAHLADSFVVATPRGAEREPKRNDVTSTNTALATRGEERNDHGRSR